MKNYFIVNLASRSGNAKQVWKELNDYLKKAHVDFEVHFTESVGHATTLAKLATASHEPVNLFVMGGDGTLNEALNGIEHFDTTYYIPLPSGSANDFVNGIGLKGSCIEIVKRALFEGGVKHFDYGEVISEKGVRRFGVSAGIGVDAYVCLQALTSKLKKFLNAIHMGKATYGLLTVGDIFTMPLSDATITADGETWDMKRVIFAAAMNCPCEGGGIPMVPYATAASGNLSAFVAHDIPRIKCLALMPSLVKGTHENKSGFDFINFMNMTISMKKPMCVHADGEHVGFLQDVEFRCVPQSLNIKGFPNS